MPDHIRPRGHLDPRIDDIQYLQTVSDWICDRFKLRHIPLKKEDGQSLKLILQIVQNKEKAKWGIAYVLYHELCHIKCNDSKLSYDIYDLLIKVKEMAKIGAITWIGSLIFSSIPNFLGPLLITGGIGLAGYALHKYYCLNPKQEQRADTFAEYQSKEIAEGAKYMFKKLIKFQKDLHHLKSGSFSTKERLMYPLIFSEQGDNKLHALIDPHPSETERLLQAKKISHEFDEVE